MISKILQMKNNYANAAVYVDHENIFELLKQYGKDPLEINFFPVILNKLKEEHKLNVIDFIIYGNFEKGPLNAKYQTILQGLGLETRHSSNNGKNSSDLEMTVDALRTLYKNPVIDVFVIISSDRDIIPLIKAIKYENKIAYVLSTKTGFNQIVIKYADHHEYIEDIFDLKEKISAGMEADNLQTANFGLIKIDEGDIENAKEVSKLFYNSYIWKNHGIQGEPISLNGYVNIISKAVNRFPNRIIEDFKLAHQLKYITIYHHPKKGLCLTEGEKKSELLENESRNI